MNKNDILNNIKNILSKITYINIDDLDENASLMGDIGISSLEILELISYIDENYNVSISEKDIRQFINITDVVNYIEEKIK